jgi:predicted MFS family arabinose efflux permease
MLLNRPSQSSDVVPEIRRPDEVDRLRDLSAAQWRSGVAAWLGWLFDGLDMHLYTVVALPFVASLLHVDTRDPAAGEYSSWIQAAFLVGWALGGGLFGRIGDRLGRSRALVLTILTYALFTGVSFFAQTWWQLLLFRFLAALGIGGEWAVGASLLSETWPVRWRPWMAAVLQSAVNVGILLASGACLVLLSYAHLPHRSVFLIGVLPALLVLWIRRSVPEPDEWQTARQAAVEAPGISTLFQGDVRRVTVLTILVCTLSLTAHWAFMFWCAQHLRSLPEVAGWSDAKRSALVSQALALLMVTSIAGNFLAAQLDRWMGYRRAIALLFLCYFLAMVGAYGVPRTHESLWWWLAAIGVCSGGFALFTMYLPPLFPTLLRTTGAGFCYNIGRLAAAFGTVFLGMFNAVGDYRLALLYAGLLFLPASGVALLLPAVADSSCERE